MQIFHQFKFEDCVTTLPSKWHLSLIHLQFNLFLDSLSVEHFIQSWVNFWTCKLKLRDLQFILTHRTSRQHTLNHRSTNWYFPNFSFFFSDWTDKQRTVIIQVDYRTWVTRELWVNIWRDVSYKVNFMKGFFNCCVERVSVNSKDNTSSVNSCIFFYVILLLKQKK